MRIIRLFSLALFLALLASSGAFAVDQGQSQPRLSESVIGFPSSTVSLVPLTSGSGNLKGIACIFDSDSHFRNQLVDIFVDGGSAQTLSIDAVFYPVESDGSGRTFTGYIPMNVRFESSLKVQLRRSSSPNVYYEADCSASWGLD